MQQLLCVPVGNCHYSGRLHIHDNVSRQLRLSGQGYPNWCTDTTRGQTTKEFQARTIFSAPETPVPSLLLSEYQALFYLWVKHHMHEGEHSPTPTA